MPTPYEEIQAFLADEQTTDDKKLDVGLLYAESMLRELGLVVTEWQATIHGLRQARLDRANECACFSPPRSAQS